MIAAWPVIAFLLLQPPCYGEPADPERLVTIGQAVAAVSDTRDDAAGLVTIAVHESALCRSVHSGARRGGPGVGLWQLEPGSHRQPPFAGLSLADTTHAAGEALWLWHHSHQCGHGLRARFAAYAGLPCGSKWAGAASRARFYGYVRWALAQGA